MDKVTKAFIIAGVSCYLFDVLGPKRYYVTGVNGHGRNVSTTVRTNVNIVFCGDMLEKVLKDNNIYVESITKM